MTEHEASRTLVKSPPELWAECSDATSLARHLNDSFGEIRITRLEPETAVAWEGERASGTVRLEPAGWGTKVVLTATAVARADEALLAQPVAEPPAVAVPVAGPPVAEVPPVAGPPAVAGLPVTKPLAVAPPVADLPVAGPPAVAELPVAGPPAAAVPVAGLPVAEPAADTAVARRRPFARFLAFLRGPEPVPHAPQPPVPGETRPAAGMHPNAVDPAAATPTPEIDDPVAEAPRPEAGEPVAEAPELEAGEPAAGAPEPETAADGVAAAPKDTQEALAAALDSLGQAHHRPYSRA
jgi:hypothetical protein